MRFVPPMSFLRALLGPGFLTAVLLSVAIAGMGVAWKTQADAAQALADAKRIQEENVPESEPDNPSPETNRRIIANLDRAVRVRSVIDRTLRDLLEVFDRFAVNQERADEVTGSAERDLRLIAEYLSRAVASSRSARRGLESTTGDLGVARGLAWKIAEELEELDRKLGPRTP
jgi:hypothetical protein